ncbi:uncharacterized protein [Chelonus insularis]|nr:uncharacterized protein LOC118071810 isoform X2 [Chelonus insularis]
MDLIDNSNSLRVEYIHPTTFRPIDIIHRRKYSKISTGYINHHFKKNRYGQQSRNMKHNSLKSPSLRNRMSSNGLMRHIFPFNVYVPQLKLPMIIRRPNKPLLTPIKIHSFTTKHILSKLPSIPPKIIVAANQGKPYSLSYSDGRGTNVNVHVNRRNKNFIDDSNSDDYSEEQKSDDNGNLSDDKTGKTYNKNQEDET